MNLSAQLRNRVGRPVLGKGRFSLTFEEAPGVLRAVQTLEPLHYSDGSDMRDIDTAWVQDETGVTITDAAFTARASLDLQAPEVLQISAQGLGISFKPLPLYYATAASSLLLPNTMQRLVQPQAVTAQIQDDTLSWDGAYGPGTLLEWRATPTGVQKWLTVDSPARLPAPTLGGVLKGKTLKAASLVSTETYLILGFAVSMPGLRAALKGKAVDLANLETDEKLVGLWGDNDTPVLGLRRPVATDAAGERVQGQLKFQRYGPSVILAAVFPLSWLQSPDRVYPLRIDPTVTIEQSDAANDGWVSQGGYSSGSIYVGTRTAADWGYQGFIRWPDSPVPKGATIQTETIKLNLAGSNGAAIDVAVEYEAVDTAAPISSNADFYARARTAVAGVWPVTTATGLKTSPNLKSGLQAVVNRPGYNVGSAVQTFLRDNLANNTATVNRVRLNTAEDASALRPVRETTYTEAATSAAGDVTVYLRTRDPNDDGYSKSPSGFNRGDYNVVGDIDSSNYDYGTYALLTLDAGKLLPQGASLIKAELIFVSYGGASSTEPFKISFQPVDDATVPTSKSDFDTRTRGGVLSWTSTPWGSRDTAYAVDVTSLVQSVVSRSGYSSGKMLLFIDGQGGGYTSNNNAQLYSYDKDPAKAPYLKVQFRDPNPPILSSVVMPY